MTDTRSRLAIDLKAARVDRHMSIPQLAHQIGINPSTMRRIENGKSKNVRGETLLAILAWAASRGIRSFAGFSIERGSLVAQRAAETFAEAREFGRRFEALARGDDPERVQ